MAKRRPGRDPEMDHQPKKTKHQEPEVSVVHVEEEVVMQTTQEAPNKEAHQESAHTEVPPSAYSEASNEPKIEINFKGSELLRAKFPKPFEVAEKIATDWVHDGRFEGIELGHPLAQYFAAKGLRKAKEIEKKVLESPITEKVAMNALTAGMKAQEIINQVKSKIKK
jgi:hypothetical protein